jgi:hypothetical protein
MLARLDRLVRLVRLVTASQQFSPSVHHKFVTGESQLVPGWESWTRLGLIGTVGPSAVDC